MNASLCLSVNDSVFHIAPEPHFNITSLTNLHLNLKSAWSEQCIVYHVFTVGHTNNQDVIQLINTVNLRQKLVDNCVMNSGAASLKEIIIIVMTYKLKIAQVNYGVFDTSNLEKIICVVILLDM